MEQTQTSSTTPPSQPPSPPLPQVKEMEQTQRIVQETIDTIETTVSAAAIGSVPRVPADASTRSVSQPADWDGANWERTVHNNLELLQRHAQETVWPKDLLFQFFLLMEALQENLAGRAELLQLANDAVVNLHDG